VIAETVLDSSFDMKEGETKVMPFLLNYRIEKRLQDQGGVLGALGKAAALGAIFADKDEEEYLVRAMCDVKGTVLDPGDSIAVALVD
jgi:hypothetical protein